MVWLEVNSFSLNFLVLRGLIMENALSEERKIPCLIFLRLKVLFNSEAGYLLFEA